MAKPRIFISSTFYDLKHIRSSMENFIDSLGFESILSEKGSIAYNPDIPLDESCYREAHSCDIFVLIIGGRYGSPISSEEVVDKTNFYERYKSITKLEYENAIKKDIPVYILIEKSVYSEYDTFKRNRENSSVNYAFVDSVNIFYFIETILNQPRNNPIFQFEKHTEIENWLKLQWAGLFQELIQKRKAQSEISELSKEVKELSNINTTLKRYLEEIVSNSNIKQGDKIIKEEENRLKESRIMNKFKELRITKELLTFQRMTLDEIVIFISKPKSFKELASDYAKIIDEKDGGKRLYEFWKTDEGKWVQDGFNEMRTTLGLSPFKKYR